MRLEDGGTLALLADEASGGVDIFSQVEVASTVVLSGAYEVDGVEVGGVGKDCSLSSVFAIPLRRYAGSVYILESSPIRPVGQLKYGGFSTKDIPLVPTIFSPSTASHETKLPSARCR